MYFCYVDESGTSDIPGNTSHFILLGIVIPVNKWKKCEEDIIKLKTKYQLEDKEIHTGWLIRKYVEQDKIAGFKSFSFDIRRSKVDTERKKILLGVQAKKISGNYKQVKKTFKQTDAYIHLTLDERKKFISEVAQTIGKWSFARIFAECIDKIHFNPSLSNSTIETQAFEQLVTRFESYLKIMKTTSVPETLGIIIHDNNETVAKRHTELMKYFQKQGTIWRTIDNIIETPLFVNSELTSMIQIADVCAYAFRRFFENKETYLFNDISKRIDKKDGVIVGARHYTNTSCCCFVCNERKNKTPTILFPTNH